MKKLNKHTLDVIYILLICNAIAYWLTEHEPEE
jgi:hypothetical protein